MRTLLDFLLQLSSSILFSTEASVFLSIFTHSFFSTSINTFKTMKFSTVLSMGLTAITALAAPTMHTKRAGLVRRAATLEDVATTGYATQNGGTTGGKGGSTIKVASLSELKSAVEGDDAAIVLITGPITGDGETVKVGSNKSVVGIDSTAGMFVLALFLCYSRHTRLYH